MPLLFSSIGQKLGKEKYFHSVMFPSFVSKQKFLLYNQIIKDLRDSRCHIKGHTFISQQDPLEEDSPTRKMFLGNVSKVWH